MSSGSLLEELRGGLIVSCQAFAGEPLFGADIMARMAVSARIGGAVGIRANGGEDIRAIKRMVDLPVIGIVKRNYERSDVFITPTMVEVEEVVNAGAEAVAADCTARNRPDGMPMEQFILQIKAEFPQVLLMADVSTLEEGIAAANAGADIVSTTLAGYTPYSREMSGPDLELIEQMAGRIKVPVFAEGRVHNPGEAAACLRKGAWAVVVGAAITRPQIVTKWFVEKMKG
jgi:N-acylglucosamine-6-phosphate 2-epimerase